MNKSLSSSTSTLHIKREKIPHTLINLGMFCHDPCQSLLLTRYSDVKQSCLPLNFGTARPEKWASGGTAPLRSWRCNLAPAAERWQQDGSGAGRQTEGSGHCIQDEQGRRQVDWVLVGVGDLLRFPSVAEERGERGEDEAGEERRELRACVAAVCPTFSLPSLFLSFSNAVPAVTLTDTLSVPIHLYLHSAVQYTSIHTYQGTIQFSLLLYTTFLVTVGMLSVLWLCLHTTYKHLGPWPCSLYSIKSNAL